MSLNQHVSPMTNAFPNRQRQALKGKSVTLFAYRGGVEGDKKPGTPESASVARHVAV